MANGEPKPGLTPAGWLVMLLVIGGLGYGGYFFMTHKQTQEPPTNGGNSGGSSSGGAVQPNGSSGGATAGSSSGGTTTGGGTEANGGNEAPDASSITMVKEYKYIPSEKLPAVTGVSNYEWNKDDPTVVFTLNVWSGWLPIYAANHGAKPNKESVFYKKHGFKVDLQLMDNPMDARSAYASGRAHVLWGTMDMMVLFAEGLMKDSRTAPRIYQQIDWSNGGDGIVVRSNIHSVKDLIGKTIACADNSPSLYYITSLLINSGIQPAQVNFKYTSTAFEASAAFVADRSLSGCVSWAPDIYKIPERVAGTRILSSTQDANKLIADVWAVRADFAKDHPEIVKGLVAGILEGMQDVQKNPGPACAWMAEAFGMTADDIKGMMGDAHRTNFAENKEFFLNENNPTNFERTWRSISFVYRELGKIGAPVPFDKIMDFSAIQEIDKSGQFQSDRDEYISQFPMQDYKKVTAEAPILTQVIRINFYPNSSNIYEPKHDPDTDLPVPNTLYDPNVEATLERVARMAGQFEAAVIAITGHTDSSMKGKIDKTAVIDLSSRRAEAVKKALVEKYHFPPNKFTTAGKGWDEPADPERPLDQALNRRVEISVFQAESGH